MVDIFEEGHDLAHWDLINAGHVGAYWSLGLAWFSRLILFLHFGLSLRLLLHQMIQRVRASQWFWTDTRVGDLVAQQDELGCPWRFWQTEEGEWPIVQERHSVHERSSVELFRSDSFHGLTIGFCYSTEHLEEVVPIQRSVVTFEFEFKSRELALDHHGA